MMASTSALALLPTLRVNSVNDPSTVVQTYTLRGIGFNTINLSATSTVGTYTDEVAYASGASVDVTF
jgi:hypothetical protein